MNISIHEIDESNAHLLNGFDNHFDVHSHLVLSAENGVIGYTIEEIPPFTKYYPEEEIDGHSYIGRQGHTVFFAFMDGKAAGQIRLRTNWNRLGYIEDLAVDVNFRHMGVGQALLRRAIDWAQEKHLAGLMLETQDINVAACKLYEKCGFVLGGFDHHLYMAFPDVSGETALFWYYSLKDKGENL